MTTPPTGFQRRRPEAPAEGIETAADAPQAPAAVEATPTTVVRPPVEKTYEPRAERKQAPADDAALPSTDDFAALLGDAGFDVKEYQTGDRVRARVAAVTGDAVFVTLGIKQEGVLDPASFLDGDGQVTVAPGDEIEAFVVSTRGGTVLLSTALRGGDGTTELLAEAAAQGIPVEGKVVSVNKGGLDVEVMGKRAFCPVSQIELGRTEQPEVHIGNTYTFKVQRCDDGGRNIVVSRAAWLQEERDARREETMQRLQPGAVLSGVVSRVADFGAFVDLGGVDGLVHVSELSWARHDHPSELVREGDPVTVKVLRVETIPGQAEPRIGLSMRELADDPFIALCRDVQVGSVLSGRVNRLAAFGAFVELRPGVDGLVHISELTHGRRVNHAQDVLAVGDEVQVQVIALDPLKRQIGLSMKRLLDDPWTRAAAQLKPGAAVSGIVDNVRDFGIFIELDGGISGLLPLSQLLESEQKTWRRQMEPGARVDVFVLDVDVERQRLTLTRRADASADERADASAWLKEQPAEGRFGTFAELLKGRR